MKSSIKMAAAVAAVALLATACGGDADSADPGTTPSSNTSSAVDGLQRLRDDGPIRVRRRHPACRPHRPAARPRLAGRQRAADRRPAEGQPEGQAGRGCRRGARRQLRRAVQGDRCRLPGRREAVPRLLAPAHRLLRRLHPRQGHQGQRQGRTRRRRTSTATAPASASSSTPSSPSCPPTPSPTSSSRTSPRCSPRSTQRSPATRRSRASCSDAADHMLMTAASSPTASPRTRSSEGDANGTASTIRATLTGQLNDHVWLAGNALQTAVRQGGDLKDTQVAGAVKALDDNSVALSKTIGSVYPDAEKPFLDSWRQHIGFFVDYTLGKATKDDAKVDEGQEGPRRLPHQLRPAHQLRRPRAARRRRRRRAHAARRLAVHRDRRGRRQRPDLPAEARRGCAPHDHDRCHPHRRHRGQQEDH